MNDLPMASEQALRELLSKLSANQSSLPPDIAKFVSENWERFWDDAQQPASAGGGECDWHCMATMSCNGSCERTPTPRTVETPINPQEIDSKSIDGETPAGAVVEGLESRLRGRAGPFTAQPGERYVDADLALAVLREALAQAAPGDGGEIVGSLKVAAPGVQFPYWNDAAVDSLPTGEYALAVVKGSQAPVGQVVAATGALKDMNIIRWLDSYNPRIGDFLYLHCYTHPTPPGEDAAGGSRG